MSKTILIFLIIIILILINHKKENFNVIKKNIYLISNDKNIDPNILKNIKPNDLTVFMNTAIHHNLINSKNNNKVLFLRSSNNNFWGYKETFNNEYKNVYFLHNDSEINNINKKQEYLYEKFKDKKQLLLIKKKNSENIYYPKNETPTTGFLTYHFLKNNYPNSNIILVGFYGVHKNYKGWNGHNYKYEKEYFRKNKVKKI